MNKETRDLYFVRSNGDKQLITRNATIESAIKTIHEFLEYHKYKSYYTRSWESSEGRWFDVGSWSEFFLWGTTEDEQCQK